MLWLESDHCPPRPGGLVVVKQPHRRWTISHFVHIPKCGGTSFGRVIRRLMCAANNGTAELDCCMAPESRLCDTECTQPDCQVSRRARGRRRRRSSRAARLSSGRAAAAARRNRRRSKITPLLPRTAPSSSGRRAAAARRARRSSSALLSVVPRREWRGGWCSALHGTGARLSFPLTTTTRRTTANKPDLPDGRRRSRRARPDPMRRGL